MQVCGPDISSGLASILPVDRIDGGERVCDIADVGDGANQCVQSDGGVDDAVVGGTTVVLNFLEVHDVGCVQVVDDV